MRFNRRMAIAATLAALCVGTASAQAWPDRPITLVVPFAPGASADGLARLLAGELSTSLGKPVVVQNQPGAGGATGLINVSKAAADGYTIGMGATGAITINPHIPDSPPLDPLRQLTPLAKIADIPVVMVSGSKTGMKNLRQVIDAARAKPDSLSWGSTGTNTAQHLSGELFNQMARVKTTHVPYRGSAPAVTDVLAGTTALAIVDLTSALPHIKAGTLSAIAVTSPKRSVAAPDIPTFAESGLPGYAASGWMGLFGPANLPAAIAARLTREVQVILAKPEVQARMLALGTEPDYIDSGGFRAIIESDSQKWKSLIATIPVSK